MGRSMQWTEDMRTVLMLLRTQTDFKDNRQKVAAVFNQIFASQLEENGYKDGMDPKRVTDTWNSRNLAGRSRGWQTVDGPPKDSIGRQHRKRLMNDIQNAVANISAIKNGQGETLTPEAGSISSNNEPRVKKGNLKRKSEDPTKDTSQAENNEMAENKTDKDISNESPLNLANNTSSDEQTKGIFNKDGWTSMSNGRQSKTSSNRRKTAPIRTVMDQPDIKDSKAKEVENKVNSEAAPTHETPDSAIPPLEMIHATDKDTILTSASFLSHDDPVYLLGGGVYYEVIDGESRDVMICDETRCKKCIKTTDDSLFTQDASQTRGLPFVHAVDKHVVERGKGFTFKQQHREYDNAFPGPDVMSKNTVAVMFSDGFKRNVLTCYAKHCDYCSGKGAKQKSKSRYEPGGELYHLVEEKNALNSIEEGEN